MVFERSAVAGLYMIFGINKFLSLALLQIAFPVMYFQQGIIFQIYELHFSPSLALLTEKMPETLLFSPF